MMMGTVPPFFKFFPTFQSHLTSFAGSSDCLIAYQYWINFSAIPMYNQNPRTEFEIWCLALISLATNPAYAIISIKARKKHTKTLHSLHRILFKQPDTTSRALGCHRFRQRPNIHPARCSSRDATSACKILSLGYKNEVSISSMPTTIYTAWYAPSPRFLPTCR